MSEQIIKLSDNAAERIKLIMSKAENSAIGVRVCLLYTSDAADES